MPKASTEARPVAPPAPDAERILARGVAVGLPIATLLGAIGVGLSSSLGPALLVVVTGALLGAILLLWTSLRSLAGDAPIDEALDEAQSTMLRRSSATAERKKLVLRALKDLELERSVGKIDEDDYEHLVADYREQAKDLMKEMDVALEAYRDKAEQLARAHLAKRGLGKRKAAPPPADAPEEAEPDEAHREKDKKETSVERPEGKESSARVACPKCSTSNEPDAAFCKKCGAPLGEEDET